MLNIFDSIKPYTFHQLVDQENKLYVVSDDNINYGISDSAIEKYAIYDGFIIDSRLRVPLKYEIIKYYRIDRILAKYQGKFGFVSAEIIPYIYVGSWQTPNDYEIVIPFLFDKIDEKDNNLFEVEMDGYTFQMDIEGIIEYQDIEQLKCVLNPHYIRGNYDSGTNILIPQCLNYTLLDDNMLCLQPISEDFLNTPYHIVGRGWIHESSDYNELVDCDWEEYTIHGAIDNHGKCIVPCIFERIEELNGLLEGFILAKLRIFFSDGKGKEYVSYSDEEYGDQYLFTLKGECVLGGFSKIEMEDKDTFRIYLHDCVYDTNGSLIISESSSYIILNKEFALKEIVNPEATYRNVYLDSIVSERNPFHVDLLKRLKLHVTPVPQTITHCDEDEVYPESIYSY